MLYVGFLPSLVGDGVCPIPSTAFWFCQVSRLEYICTCACLKEIVITLYEITNNCVNWLCIYDVGMHAGEKEINTLRQCVFPFRSKNVCTLLLPLIGYIRRSAMWSEQDYGSDGPGSISRRGALSISLVWKVVFMGFSFNYGEIYRHPTPTTCLQHRCMDAVRDLYR